MCVRVFIWKFFGVRKIKSDKMLGIKDSEWFQNNACVFLLLVVKREHSSEAHF